MERMHAVGQRVAPNDRDQSLPRAGARRPPLLARSWVPDRPNAPQHSRSRSVGMPFDRLRTSPSTSSGQALRQAQDKPFDSRCSLRTSPSTRDARSGQALRLACSLRTSPSTRVLAQDKPFDSRARSGQALRQAQDKPLGKLGTSSAIAARGGTGWHPVAPSGTIFGGRLSRGRGRKTLTCWWIERNSKARRWLPAGLGQIRLRLTATPR